MAKLKEKFWESVLERNITKYRNVLADKSTKCKYELSDREVIIGGLEYKLMEVIVPEGFLSNSALNPCSVYFTSGNPIQDRRTSVLVMPK